MAFFFLIVHTVELFAAENTVFFLKTSMRKTHDQAIIIETTTFIIIYFICIFAFFFFYCLVIQKKQFIRKIINILKLIRNQTAQ